MAEVAAVAPRWPRSVHEGPGMDVERGGEAYEMD